ncbi:hypothetical protein [Parasitella parasitica]|uniref:Arb2 domain-containing protein n=1 Tax=Parasitella parasitica TaxID=35722 RepID=A0A0B7NH58_9FUNG|nr:hypothetical protein [Parasitella parasitica]
MYRRRKPKADDRPVIPDKLEDFGYIVKENGEVRSNNEADQPYVFDYLPKDKPYNEARYDKFIDLVGDVVEERLQKEPYNFQKVIVPIGADPAQDVHSYIYMTPNAMTTTGKLMVMIPGNNTRLTPSRIGQWSRRVMCDTNIKAGSMMEISELVFEKGYEVIILNSNANFWYNDSVQTVPQKHTNIAITVPDNDTPEAHCQYVFHNIVRNVKAEKVAVMAYGWGGHSFVLTLNTEYRIKAVALVNSVHVKDAVKGEKERAFVYNNCCNWSATTDKKGSLVPDVRLGCTNISSGEEIADYTLRTMLKNIMNYIFVRMGDIEWDSDIESDEDEPKELTEEDMVALSQIDVLSSNA